MYAVGDCLHSRCRRPGTMLSASDIAMASDMWNLVVVESDLTTLARRGVDRASQRSTNALIAIGGIVQSVPRYEGAGWQPRLDCAAHERKAWEQADTLLPCCLGNDGLHVRML